MYKPSTCLVVITYFPTYFAYVWDLFLTELVTKVKPEINSVDVHPQLSNNGHAVDGALVGAGSLMTGTWRSVREESALFTAISCRNVSRKVRVSEVDPNTCKTPVCFLVGVLRFVISQEK